MRKTYLFILLLAYAFIAGCSSGSSTIEYTDGDTTDVLSAVTLEGSRQGQAVAFADADGDGIADKLVGAPYAEAGSALGAVIVYKGDGDGNFPMATAVLTGDDNLGYSLINAGDVDGDGMDDFASGAINGDGVGASMSGSVSVYKSGGVLLGKLSGEYPMDKFGYSLSSGDLNADGLRDVIVGAPFNTNTPSLYQSGAVYISFGPDLQSGFSLHATDSKKGLGFRVSSGMVNDDVISDLLVSASGKVLVYFGGESFNPSLNSPDIELKCSASGFGKATAVIGDIDGDGFGEIAVGAPNAKIGTNRDQGSVYIVSGSSSGTVDICADPAPSELRVRIDGESLFDRFGASIAPAGDIDGDSLPDFAVSAPMADTSMNKLAGKVYMFKGKDVNSSCTLNNSMALNGMAKDQNYGMSLMPLENGMMLIGGPGSSSGTGGVMMVDMMTGQSVSGGSSGGSTGDSGSCH